MIVGWVAHSLDMKKKIVGVKLKIKSMADPQKRLKFILTLYK